MTTTVPTNSQSTVIPWQDWAEQGIVHLTPIIEMAAEGAATIAFASMPWGAIVENFIGPNVVKQAVDSVLSAAEAFLSSQPGVSVPAANTIETLAANAINATAPALAAQLGPKLLPMIKAAVAKALPVPVAPAPPNAPAIHTGR